MPASAPLKQYLDQLVDRFEQPSFIPDDPIAIPHGFEDPRDQEVIGLYAALLAWGQRKTILAKMADLCERMAFQPYRFVRDFDPAHHQSALTGFKHRTFQPIDALWLTHTLSHLLKEHQSVERLFARHLGSAEHVGPAIQGFSEQVMTTLPGTPARLQKHLARPNAGSACKRLCMYLRWMVRTGPVDFGIWKTIHPSQLVLPLDVHSGTQARRMGLLTRTNNDWKAALELTSRCRELNAADPCAYDYAFFGVGAYKVELDPRFIAEERATPR